MKTYGHTRRPPRADRALLEHLCDRQADQAEATMIRAGQKGGHLGRNNLALSRRFY
jgi:hypothetical protein